MKTFEERFWAKVQKTPTCWLWKESKTNKGYGRIKRDGRNVLAHRASYELTYGPIPEGEGYHGMCVCHTCDNRVCVRPDHLFLGSQGDNMADKKEKSRAASGDRNGRAKLTAEQVLAIRAATGSQVKIASAYMVSKSLVGYIRTGKLWAHVP